MRGLKVVAVVAVFSALLIGSASGCGGGAPQPPQKRETVESLLPRAGAAMADATTLRFSIRHEGAPVAIGAEGIEATFENATGRFAAPSSAEAVIAVTAGSLRTEVGAVAIDGEVWITDPLTGRWAAAPDAFQFDPARIFRADVGLSALLTAGLSDATLTSPYPDADGRFHVTAHVSAARVSRLTSGLVEDVEDAEFWIDADTYLLSETRFAVPLGRGDTRWTLQLSDYGTAVDIAAPTIG